MNNIFGADGSDEVVCIDRFLGDEAVNLICQRLRGTDLGTKKRLILRGNCIGHTGARALGDLLKSSNELRFLSVEWNQVGSAGARSIADGLVIHQGLTHLDLRNNAIDNDGAIALALSLMNNNKSVKTLDLRWNKIEDKGALAFKDCICERSPPLNLLIGGNLLSEAALKCLDEWMHNGSKKPPPVPEVVVSDPNLAYAYQNELLQKEVANLRAQLISLQSTAADVQRQLDTSALRVTELEQALHREEYRSNHLAEALRHANERISRQADEQNALAAMWDKEREDMRNELNRVRRDRENEMRALMQERDSWKEKAETFEEEASKLKSQLENLLIQSKAEKKELQDELRLCHGKINQYMSSEFKLKAENSSLQQRLDSANDRVRLLSHELEENRITYEKSFLAESERHASDMEKLRVAHALLVKNLQDKVTALSQEVGECKFQLHEARSELLQQQMEMDRRIEEKVKEARLEEKEMAARTHSELTQRVNALTLARSDLETRCAGYVSEIKTMQSEHQEYAAHMQNHVANLEQEMSRLRSNNTNLKSLLSSTEADNKAKESELRDLRKKYNELSERAEDQKNALEAQKAENKQLSYTKDKLEQHLEHLLKHRAEVRQFMVSSLGEWDQYDYPKSAKDVR